MYYPVIMPVEFNPKQFGFEKIDEYCFSNGIIDLEDQTQLDDDDDTEEVTKFTKLGFAVRRSGESEYLYEPVWNQDSDRFEGITQVHEIQNVLADLLPEVDLNTQDFVEFQTSKIEE